MSKSEKPELVYGNSGEGITFASIQQARGDAFAHTFLYESATWGELMENSEKFNSSIYEDALERWIEEKKDEGWSTTEPDKEIVIDTPAMTDPFDPDEIPGHADGDWPFTLKYETEYWIPKEIADEYGEWIQTILSGDYLVILPEHAETVADQLRKEGYTCTEDSDLVWNACYGG